MIRPVALLLAALAALALTACGRDDPGQASGDDGGATRTVERRTRVEVLSEQRRSATADGGGRGAAFDPGRIYRRDSPGVVTVISGGIPGTSAGATGLGS